MTPLETQKQIIKRHQNNFPVELIPIAKELGVNVYNTSGWPNDLSGMIRIENEDRSNPNYAIYVNATHPVTRRRFTIAHEIAHFVMHRHLIGDGIVDDGLYRSNLSSVIETEANNFAADILMPWHLLNQATSQGIRTVPELAAAFKVSKSAISIRLGIPYETYP